MDVGRRMPRSSSSFERLQPSRGRASFLWGWQPACRCMAILMFSALEVMAQESELISAWNMEVLSEDPFDSVTLDFLEEGTLEVKVRMELDFDGLVQGVDSESEEIPNDVDFSFGTGILSIVIKANWQEESSQLSIAFESVEEILVNNEKLETYFSSLYGRPENEEDSTGELLLGILVTTIEQEIAQRAAEIAAVFDSVSFQIDGDVLTIYSQEDNRRFVRAVSSNIVPGAWGKLKAAFLER